MSDDPPDHLPGHTGGQSGNHLGNQAREGPPGAGGKPLAGPETMRNAGNRQCRAPVREGFTWLRHAHASHALSGPRARGLHESEDRDSLSDAVRPTRARASRIMQHLNDVGDCRAPARVGSTAVRVTTDVATVSGPRARGLHVPLERVQVRREVGPPRAWASHRSTTSYGSLATRVDRRGTIWITRPGRGRRGLTGNRWLARRPRAVRGDGSVGPTRARASLCPALSRPSGRGGS